MPSSHGRRRSGSSRRTPGGLGGATPAEAASEPSSPGRGLTLHVELQEGWVDDTVQILVNGEPVTSRSGVRTKPQSGLAEMVETEVPAGPTTVRVEVTSRQLVGEHHVTMDAEHWVGVSVTDTDVQFRDQDRLFGYV